MPLRLHHEIMRIPDQSDLAISWQPTNVDGFHLRRNGTVSRQQGGAPLRSTWVVSTKLTNAADGSARGGELIDPVDQGRSSWDDMIISVSSSSRQVREREKQGKG